MSTMAKQRIVFLALGLCVVVGLIMKIHVFQQNIKSGPRKENSSQTIPMNSTLPKTKDLQDKIDNVVLVLIFAYYRSGSTFFSEMFDSNPEAFYVFEPLIALQNNMKIVNDIQKITKWYAESDEWFQSVSNVLEKIFRCQLDELPMTVLKHQFMQRSKGSNHYSACLTDTHMSLNYCSRLLTKLCLSSKIRAVKVIRIHRRFDILTYLMKTLPNLKIIHLVRDPRGMLMSRMALNTNNVPVEINEICKDFQLDICEHIGIFESNPQRVAKIVYEDMAENPYNVTQTVYRFLQQHPPQIVIASLRNKSSAKTNGDSYDTSRQNSTITAYSWMRKISPDIVRVVDANCSVIYGYAGYSKLIFDKQLQSQNERLRVTGMGVNARKACALGRQPD